MSSLAKFTDENNSSLSLFVYHFEVFSAKFIYLLIYLFNVEKELGT